MTGERRDLGCLGLIGGIMVLVGGIMFVTAVFAGCAGCANGSQGLMTYGLYAGAPGFFMLVIGGVLYGLGGGKAS